MTGQGAQGAIHSLRADPRLVCRVQTDLGVETAYVLCAPVVAQDGWGPPVPRLHIPVVLDGRPHLIVMTQLVALPAGAIGPMVGHAGSARDAIVAAVDLLVSGF